MSLIRCFIVEGSDVKNDVEEGFGCCGYILIGLSYVVFIFTLPLSLFVSIKVGLFVSIYDIIASCFYLTFVLYTDC